MSIPFDPTTWRKRRVRAEIVAHSHVFSEAVNHEDAERGIHCADRQLPGGGWRSRAGEELFVQPNDAPILWATADGGKTFVLVSPYEVEEVPA